MAYKIVNDDSLTSVANAIRVQGSISGTLEFPDGFVSAIQNLSPSPTLQTKSVTYTPSDSAVTDTVTADSGYDGLDEVDVTVNAVPEADFGASVGLQFYTEDGVEKCEVSGGGYAENAGWIDEGAVLTREVHPAIASGTTITPTTSSQTIGGYKNVMEGAVTINPIPSNYKDTTDATATADKILQGYTAYANGQKLTGTASGGITPSGTIQITQNGVVDVTNYASANVNVSGGGASNIVVGAFKPTEIGTLDIQLAYTGTGYPIKALLTVKDGFNNPNNAFHDLVSQNAVCAFYLEKAITTSAPDYDTTTASNANRASHLNLRKNSSTNANSYNAQGISSGGGTVRYGERATLSNAVNNIAAFPSNNTLRVYVSADGSHGFRVGTTYEYFIVYSS